MVPNSGVADATGPAHRLEGFGRIGNCDIIDCHAASRRLVVTLTTQPFADFVSLTC